MSTETQDPKTEPKTSSKKAMYRPLMNWRHGLLYEEGKEYDLSDIPKATIEAAIEAGHLEVV